MSKKIIKEKKVVCNPHSQREIGSHKCNDNTKNTDPIHTLMTLSVFEKPPQKKQPNKPIKSKELEIDYENDSQEDIIRKLVLTIQNLQKELESYKEYVEGTFCTNAVYNRQYDEIEKKVNNLSSELDEIRS